MNRKRSIIWEELVDLTHRGHERTIHSARGRARTATSRGQRWIAN
jgi:hypothetical protein